MTEEEIIYNLMEEKAYQVKDIADLLIHYFMNKREVIVPLSTVIKELYALLLRQGWEAPLGQGGLKCMRG